MSTSTKKSAAAAPASARKTAALSAPAPKSPAKKSPPAEKKKAPAKAPAKKASTDLAKKGSTALMKKEPAKAPALTNQPPAKAQSKKSSREAMLARVESVRLAQRNDGHFDCFGRAEQGYCDQGVCAYHAECLSISRLLHSL